jgi:hypothetical protein
MSNTLQNASFPDNVTTPDRLLEVPAKQKRYSIPAIPESSRDKKMIVRTFQAAESAGVSTDMHSTVGKTTIHMYR